MYKYVGEFSSAKVVLYLHIAVHWQTGSFHPRTHVEDGGVPTINYHVRGKHNVRYCFVIFHQYAATEDRGVHSIKSMVHWSLLVPLRKLNPRRMQIPDHMMKPQH